MAKSPRKKTTKTAKKSKSLESIDCLLELHRLQGVLLNEVRNDLATKKR